MQRTRIGPDEGNGGGRLKNWMETLIALAVVFTAAVTVRAEDFSAWSHAADVRINTKPGGADVAGDVADFPLLVRLDSTTFPFAEAKPDGADLRVSAPDGAALHFQVERWDARARRAEVWIRVPLIKGNSDTGFVRLYWGNAQALSASDGQAVFDTALGWAGAWHLNDPALLDASGASAAADGSNSQGAEGLIAGGRLLAGNGGGIPVADGPALDPVSALTVTVWFRAETWNGAVKCLLQKGAETIQYALVQEAGDSLAWTLGGPSQGAVLKAPLPGIGAWHMVAATYDGSMSRIYMDGHLAASQSASGSLSRSADNLCLGCRPAVQGKPRNSFKGSLDETTVSRKARSADFLMLAFANQRAQQVLTLSPRLASCHAAFGASADTSVAEGGTIVLRGKADCAASWNWNPVSGPAPRILDPEVADLTVAVPRISGDTVIAYRFTARFGDSVASHTVKVRVREAIPDPRFSLDPVPSWNGQVPLALRPAISNLAVVKSSRDSVIRFAWTLSGPPIDTVQADGALILKRAMEPGLLTVGLCLDNGGEVTCRSFEMAVGQGLGVAQANQGKPERPLAPSFKWRDAAGRSLGRKND